MNSDSIKAGSTGGEIPISYLKLTGLGYLIIFLTGIFSNFFVLEGLTLPEGTYPSINLITENESLFRIGIFSFLMMVVFDVLLAWTLFILLRPVNKDLSLLSAWLRLVNGTIFGVAMFKLLGVLQLISGEDYLNIYDQGMLQAETILLLNDFNNIWLIGLIFFGMHLAVMGYLIYKSGYIPKILGILLIIAAFGYLTDSFANFLFSAYSDYKDIFMMIVVIPGIVGEFSFTVWLLYKGFKGEGRK